jgi:hypothetical protein
VQIYETYQSGEQDESFSIHILIDEKKQKKKKKKAKLEGKVQSQHDALWYYTFNSFQSQVLNGKKTQATNK